jgi:predicted transcriptional regulator
VGQVTICLDERTERKLDIAARKSSLSKSRWIANLIRERAAEACPDEINGLAAGAWRDFPLADARRRDRGRDTDREPY